MRLRSHLLILPALLALAACDGGTDAPPGGDYRAVLQSPNGAEGAAAIELTGTGIETVTATGALLASSAVSGGQRVVVIRETPGEIAFTVRITPGNRPPSARVVEVAGGDDQLRASTNGYQVSFTRAEVQ